MTANESNWKCALARWTPRAIAGVVLVALASFAGRAWNPPQAPGTAMDLHAFGELPTAHGGRVKPFDTLARHQLMAQSDYQTYVDTNGVRQPAIRWLLDVLTPNGAFRDQRVYRVDNDQLLSQLGLEERPGNFKYSFAELEPHWDLVFEQRERVKKTEPAERDAFDLAATELADQLEMLAMLRGWHEPHALPPLEAGGEWLTFHAAEKPEPGVSDGHPAANLLTDIVLAYDSGNAAEFNVAVAAYRGWLAEHAPAALRRAHVESIFNRFDPFGIDRTIGIYLLALLLVCAGWLGFAGPLNRAAIALIVIALVVHTIGLATRIYIMERPPVTNLYSSAVFIGWGIVGLALLMEKLFKNGVGTLLGAFSGAATLLVAFGLSKSGDTMAVLQAVLDTKFWLATHVICITLGYTATYLAGLLGCVLIVRGALTRSLDQKGFRSLGRMIYGVLCFAALLSFVGTVLGGIWADQSWGRFWGWDPKENGALMIVLWNALILHARWGGMVQERGVATLAVAGNIVTSWSWFGVNMLGVGLHSYGFMDQALTWLLVFIATQLGIMAIAARPLARWRSIAAAAGAATPPPEQLPGRMAPAR